MENMSQRFQNWIKNFNLFSTNIDQDDGNTNFESTNTKLKHQLYATRLYVIMFIGEITHVIILYVHVLIGFFFFQVLFYLLIYSVSMESNDRLVLIEKITESQFHDLLIEYPESLSCLCSNTAVTYKKFVSNKVKISNICSSAFVNLSWIRALHIPTASLYLSVDFRASAEAQVLL